MTKSEKNEASFPQKLQNNHRSCTAGFTLATYTHTTTAAQHQAAAILGSLVSTGNASEIVFDGLRCVPFLSTFGSNLGQALDPNADPDRFEANVEGKYHF
ncbi:MAG: hypothetical protein J5789_00650 [Oscillospiraceae bacterium]|nr:hypothetical protein [Oscillospiraceae bacterium]